MKKALITGITGQDGSYLAELLLSKGYEVHGIIRRCSTFNTDRIDHIYTDPHIPGTRMFLHYGDLADGVMLIKLLYEIKPDEIYHLGAQTHVRVSFDIPEYTGDVTGLGTLRILEAIRELHFEDKCRFYQASSSEMFGLVQEVPQTESTPFYPRSPYGVAKLYAYWITVNYREAYGIYACNGILFNHESPIRGETFVRGYMRNYARLLGVPSSDVDSSYDKLKRARGPRYTVSEINRARRNTSPGLIGSLAITLGVGAVSLDAKRQLDAASGLPDSATEQAADPADSRHR